MPRGDPDLHSVQGMIDCTAHWRVEIQGDGSWFRTDVGAANLGAQVVASLNCEIWDVVFFAGHSNDLGIYSASGMNQILQPDDVVPDDPYFEAKHRAVRAAIERLFWFNQSWSVSGQVCRLPLALHVQAVDATWRLTAWLMRRSPMSPAVDAVVVDDDTMTE